MIFYNTFFNKYNSFIFIYRHYSSLNNNKWIHYKYKNISLEYQIIILKNGFIEYLFLITDFNEIILKIIFDIIITSDQFIKLQSPTINFMTAINEGSWISIGSGLKLTKNIKEKDFILHYMKAINNIKDKHYINIEINMIRNLIIIKK